MDGDKLGSTKMGKYRQGTKREEVPKPQSNFTPAEDLAPANNSASALGISLGTDGDGAKSPKLNHLLIAALGASAGGLEAFEGFFKHMPDNEGCAFLIVQHLSPDHASALVELLGRHTRMTVTEAKDNMPVLVNQVYVIPPNATLTIKNCVLHVALPLQAHGRRMPIDSLFSSLAEDRGENAVCIVLSGTGTDGTLGLKAIKEHGGMAMAQTSESAKHDAMPRSVIATGFVDHVLPVEEMPAKLIEYAARLKALSGDGNGDSSSNGDSNLTGLHDQIGARLDEVYALLRRRAGHDFSQYKQKTSIRRLERRMKAIQIETIDEYLQFLDRQPEEADKLFNDLLIGVTHFFRDPEAFEAFGRDVVPRLFDGKDATSQVRVCVVGCASGEEAYSIAILLCEYASTLAKPPKIQIFATDIDERGLEIARKGRYPASIADHVSAERLECFFTQQDGSYLVNRNLREICIFSNHSFIKDPPFSRLDLISCRNVMIYIGTDLQQKVIPLFHYSLRSGGFLFLGPSENVSAHPELFGAIDKKHRLFQRKDSVPRPTIRFPLAGISRPKRTGDNRTETEDRSFPKQLERVILKRHGPACVIVMKNGDAVYFSGRTGRYLEQPTGSPDPNVVNMAREGLQMPLRTSLHLASTEHVHAVQRRIPVQTDGGLSLVDLTVEPLNEFPNSNLYMVVFEDTPTNGSEDGALPPSDIGSEAIIRHLEGELRIAQDSAQAAYEELETSNEELQSANEEYQSTNEELESSKEELQSSNEELETVNSELNRKVAELDFANSYLQNLLNSTQVATIFLDPELRIRNFTPAAGIVFRLIPGDVGRPITDLAAQFADVGLIDDIIEVLKSLTTRERDLAGAQGRHYLLRILPYRTIHNVIDGVVVTFTDVTQLKQAEQFAEDAKTFAESIVDTVREPLLVLDKELRVQSANQSFYKTFNVTANETPNCLFYELGNHQWDIPELRRLLGEVLPEKEALEDFQVEHDFPVIGRKTMLLNARQISQQKGKIPLILLAIEDITERRRAEELQVRLAAIVESSDDAIVSENLSAIIQSWNRGAERIFGYSAAEVIGKSISILAIPERAGENAGILERISRGQHIDHYETEWRTKDGRIISVSLTVSPIVDSSGAVVSTSTVARDITQQKLSEIALRTVNQDLEHFAYAASHDLQEPLRMVTSYTQLLARQYKGKLDQQADEFISYAVEGAHRMEMLLKGLRDYWAVNDGRVQENVLVDCNRLLQKTLTYLAARIQESSAVVTFSDLPTVMAAELPLLLLFQNLISNALKYRRPNCPPQIHISAEKIANSWNFSVSDNGIGIEPQHLKSIFAPFKRLHGAEYPGSGIGLAICQKIAQRYHGRIWVESVPLQGSTFHFTIPARENEG